MSENKPTSDTRLIATPVELEKNPEEIISLVFNALEEKGYDPIRQFTWYLITGDPTYITSHNNSRTLISSVDRDEILEVIIRKYFETNK